MLRVKEKPIPFKQFICLTIYYSFLDTYLVAHSLFLDQSAEGFDTNAVNAFFSPVEEM